MKNVIGFLIGFIIGIIFITINLAHASNQPMGKSKICDDIGYLSTACSNVQVLPMEYKNKEVAIEKAKQPVVNETHIVNVKIDQEALIKKIINHSDQDDVIIKTWFEQE